MAPVQPFDPPSAAAPSSAMTYEQLRQAKMQATQRAFAELQSLSADFAQEARRQAGEQQPKPRRSWTQRQLFGKIRRSSRLQNSPAAQYHELEGQVHSIERRTSAGRRAWQARPMGSAGSAEVGAVVRRGREEYTEEDLKKLRGHVKPYDISIERNKTRVYDPVNGKTCHQCRQKTLGLRTECASCKDRSVCGQFCGDCLFVRYGENVEEALADPTWECPVCRDICNCSICRNRKGWGPTGQLFHKVWGAGYQSVAHYLMLTRMAKGGEIKGEEVEEVEEVEESEEEGGELGSGEGEAGASGEEEGEEGGREEGEERSGIAAIQGREGENEKDEEAGEGSLGRKRKGMAGREGKEEVVEGKGSSVGKRVKDEAVEITSSRGERVKEERAECQKVPGKEVGRRGEVKDEVAGVEAMAMGIRTDMCEKKTRDSMARDNTTRHNMARGNTRCDTRIWGVKGGSLEEVPTGEGTRGGEAKRERVIMTRGATAKLEAESEASESARVLLSRSILAQMAFEVTQKTLKTRKSARVLKSQRILAQMACTIQQSQASAGGRALRPPKGGRGGSSCTRGDAVEGRGKEAASAGEGKGVKSGLEVVTRSSVRGMGKVGCSREKMEDEESLRRPKEEFESKGKVEGEEEDGDDGDDVVEV
ncbi:hypothetical protein CLOM_g3283 [Closterium sp. NIES-68]|nr:hypothetical protein CLOM_g3283 [Closterium sp. NIES-68]GJP73075.1 hypothetical protein CLOP_g3826 [Closterium sp. NIES-67]